MQKQYRARHGDLSKTMKLSRCCTGTERLNMDKNRNRKFRMNLRLSDDELRILDAKVALSVYRDRNAYLRALIIYDNSYSADYSELHDYNVTLARIASSLNQIAKRVNTTGSVYRNDMNEVKELMNRVWHTHESMLSRQPSTNQ